MSTRSGESLLRARTRAALFGLILRQSVNAICGLVYLAQPEHTPAGVGIAVVLTVWGVVRLWPHRTWRPAWLVWVDYALVIVVALTIPQTIGQLDIAESNSLPLAVCGSGVLSFTFSQRHWHALAATIGIAFSFAVGATPLPEVDSPFSLFWPYFFLVQCAIGVALRQLVERSARAADLAASEFAVVCHEHGTTVS